MRNYWKIGVALFIVAFLSMMLVAQDVQEPVQPANKPIAGAGCVQAGVETGCLLLKDSKTGTLYNVFFSGNKPAAGDAIQFSGVGKVGVNTCMQGKPVAVKEWKPIKMDCRAATASKKPELIK